MHINGHNPYKKGFDMLVADIEESKDKVQGMPVLTDARGNDLYPPAVCNWITHAADLIKQQAQELKRLRVIEAAAVAAVNFDQWQGDEWYELMMALQKALADGAATEVLGTSPRLCLCDDGVWIVYEHGKPSGIRDSGGFMFFFRDIMKYEGQDDRYREEREQQQALADFLLAALKTANDPNSGAARGPIAGGPLE